MKFFECDSYIRQGAFHVDPTPDIFPVFFYYAMTRLAYKWCKVVNCLVKFFECDSYIRQGAFHVDPTLDIFPVFFYYAMTRLAYKWCKVVNCIKNNISDILRAQLVNNGTGFHGWGQEN